MNAVLLSACSFLLVLLLLEISASDNIGTMNMIIWDS